MAVTSRTLLLQRQLADDLTRVTDNQARDLVRAWAEAWDEVQPDLTAALLEQLVAGERVTRAQLLRSVRLGKALQAIKDQLETQAAAAGVRISTDLQAVVDAAGAAQAPIIDSQLPPLSDILDGLDTWTRVDARQITAIVTRSTQQITSLTKPIAPEAYAILRRELIRGIAAGSNPRQTAARIVRRAEGRFNGGLTRALVIARTETIDAHRAAAQLSQAQHAGVLTDWVWLSALDSRTCPSCWSKHGTRHPLSEAGPHDHQQGRCSRLPVTKTWAELGFDVPEPPSLLPDATERFEALSAAEQRAILGPGRYAAWQDGRFPMDDWSVRRTSDGWRDSWGVAPVPQSAGRDRAVA